MAFVALMALFYVGNPSREETAAQAMSSPPEFRAPDGWYLPTGTSTGSITPAAPNEQTPDASVDVIISNCVINLAADKILVLAEAFRVLRPGGRVAISDMVVHGEIPEALRLDMDAWAGCVSGALEARDYEEKLTQAGFDEVSIEPTKSYGLDGADERESWASLQAIEEGQRAEMISRFTSSTVRARKRA